MTAYGVFLTLWVSFLCMLPVGVRWVIVIVVLGITCILPVIAITVMHNFKVITDTTLEKRTERTIPYVVGIVCTLGAAFYLHHTHSPMWFVMFPVGAALTTGVLMLVNLKWKISAHLAGVGGVTALLYQIHAQALEAFDLLWLICFTILAAGALGTSRILLGKHTLAQVLAGYAVGYVCVALTIAAFG